MQRKLLYGNKIIMLASELSSPYVINCWFLFLSAIAYALSTSVQQVNAREEEDTEDKGLLRYNHQRGE